MRFSGLLFILAMSTVAFAVDPSVGPLHLGMTPQEAAQALGTGYTPGKSLRSPDPQGPAVATYIRPQSEEVLLQFVNNRLYLIDRVQVFVSGSQPNLNTTNQRLEEKYGAKAFSQGSQTIWMWNGAGTPSQDRQCSFITGVEGANDSPNKISMQGNAAKFYTNFRSNCGVTVVSHVIGDSGDGELLKALHITLVDQKPMYDYSHGLNQRSQQQKAVQDEKSKQNKAPL